MRATATFPSRPRGPAMRLVPDQEMPAHDPGRPSTADLLALAARRAALAERRLRSRLLELTWPATAAALAGGFAAVVAIRWAGL